MSFYCWPEITGNEPGRFRHYGALHYRGLWISDADFILCSIDTLYLSWTVQSSFDFIYLFWISRLGVKLCETSWEGTSLHQTVTFVPLCLSVGLCRCERNKTGRQEGRKKIIWSIFFKHAFSDPQRAVYDQTWKVCRYYQKHEPRFHRYNFGVFGAVRR